MPSIFELLIILVLTIAIGIATRFFGKPGLGARKRTAPSASKSSSKGDKGKKLELDPDSGVYVSESDDTKNE